MIPFGFCHAFPGQVRPLILACRCHFCGGLSAKVPSFSGGLLVTEGEQHRNQVSDKQCPNQITTDNEPVSHSDELWYVYGHSRICDEILTEDGRTLLLDRCRYGSSRKFSSRNP